MHSDPKSLWIPRVSSAPSIVERKEGVLIVNEDESARAQIDKLVQAEGYQTYILESSNDVPQMVTQSQPDLILLDVTMASGLELCAELRMLEQTRDVPIILISAKPASEELVARGLLAGADDYVAIERSVELRARVRVQLRNKRYRDALQRVRDEREAFRRQAAVDSLTGLLNRRSLSDIISDKVLAGDPFALLFVDIDHFKSINDRFGHGAGDNVLKSVAECLKRGMRVGDYCGRYGGEEFVVVAPAFVTDQAFTMAERHRVAIAALKHPELPEMQHVTVSIGIALFEAEDGETSEDILERADTALYMAKTTGRNRTVVAHESTSRTMNPVSGTAC